MKFLTEAKIYSKDTPVTLQKNQLLSFGSIDILKSQLIEKDVRNLTSGGLNEIEKYYKRVIKVDFKNLGIALNDIQEIHTRRHLFVHRDGYVDAAYSKKFSSNGYSEGDKILLDNTYLVKSLEKLVEFASAVNKELLKKFPQKSTHVIYDSGETDFNFSDKTNFMIELLLESSSFAHVPHLKQIAGLGGAKGKILGECIVQITTTGKKCIIFLSGSSLVLRGFIAPLRRDINFKIVQIIKIK